MAKEAEQGTEGGKVGEKTRLMPGMSHRLHETLWSGMWVTAELLSSQFAPKAHWVAVAE